MYRTITADNQVRWYPSNFNARIATEDHALIEKECEKHGISPVGIDGDCIYCAQHKFRCVVEWGTWQKIFYGLLYRKRFPPCGYVR